MSFDVEQAVGSLQNEFPQHIVDIKEYRNETTILIDKESIHKICNYLKHNLDFTFLADLTAVDYLEVKSPRYEVVYHIHRFGPDCEENVRIRLKAELTDSEPTIDSVVSIWSGADWLEREVYDMFGIKFIGHPRKDFDVRNREASKKSFEKALEDGTD